MPVKNTDLLISFDTSTLMYYLGIQNPRNQKEVAQAAALAGDHDVLFSSGVYGGRCLITTSPFQPAILLLSSADLWYDALSTNSSTPCRTCGTAP